MTSYRIGADIGGTFTDLVLMDASGTTFEIGKILTTPDEPEKAVEQGVQQLLASAASPPVTSRTSCTGRRS